MPVAFLGAFETQFTLMLTLVQVAHRGREQRAAEWLPDALAGSYLSSIR